MSPTGLAPNLPGAVPAGGNAVSIRVQRLKGGLQGGAPVAREDGGAGILPVGRASSYEACHSIPCS